MRDRQSLQPAVDVVAAYADVGNSFTVQWRRSVENIGVEEEAWAGRGKGAGGAARSPLSAGFWRQHSRQFFWKNSGRNLVCVLLVAF